MSEGPNIKERCSLEKPLSISKEVPGTILTYYKESGDVEIIVPESENENHLILKTVHSIRLDKTEAKKLFDFLKKIFK
jgi:hypothetical protein